MQLGSAGGGRWRAAKRQKVGRSVLWLMVAVLVASLVAGCWPLASRRPEADPPSSPGDETSPNDSSVHRIDHTNVPAPDFSSLRQQIRDRMDGHVSRYAIYIEDIASGQAMGINERKPFVAASTIKIPVVLYLYDQADKGYISLDESMTYLDRDYETGTGQIQYEQVGTQYTLRELAKQSLMISDNVAANMLIRRLGKERIHQFMRDLGGETVSDDHNVTSARDMGIYLRSILTLSRRNSRLGSELVGFLCDSAFSDRIRAGVPHEVRVAHKIGNQVGYRHDVGIVFVPSRTFLIAVLVEDPNEERVDQAIADVSRLAYRFFADLPKVSTPTPP